MFIRHHLSRGGVAPHFPAEYWQMLALEEGSLQGCTKIATAPAQELGRTHKVPRAIACFGLWLTVASKLAGLGEYYCTVVLSTRTLFFDAGKAIEGQQSQKLCVFSDEQQNDSFVRSG